MNRSSSLNECMAKPQTCAVCCLLVLWSIVGVKQSFPQIKLIKAGGKTLTIWSWLIVIRIQLVGTNFNQLWISVINLDISSCSKTSIFFLPKRLWHALLINYQANVINPLVKLMEFISSMNTWHLLSCRTTAGFMLYSYLKVCFNPNRNTAEENCLITWSVWEQNKNDWSMKSTIRKLVSASLRNYINSLYSSTLCGVFSSSILL